jgi:hypothetical protein
MRKLLQSKTAVSSLCVIAVLIGAGNFVKLPVRRLIPVAARPAALSANSAEAEVLQIPSTPRICAELTGWHELFPSAAVRRDPFAIAGGVGPKTSGATNAPLLPVFVLQAVSLEAGRALAVINRTVVATGESLGDYVVERIEPSEVWLKNSFGRVIVPMDQTAALRNKTP